MSVDKTTVAKIARLARINVPNGRLEPRPPTSTRALVATVFRDEGHIVLAVVNRTDQRIQGAVDLRGIAESGVAIEPITENETAFQSARFELTLDAFEGRFFRIE